MKEGPKIQEDIQRKKEETGKDKLNLIDIVQATWKHALPIIASDTAGSALVIDGLRVEHKRAVGFATAAGIAEETLRLTKSKEEETVGKSKSEDIQQAVEKDEAEIAWARQSTIFETGHGNQLFLDKVTGIVFKSDRQYLEQCETEFNAWLLRRQDIPLTDWYDVIGLRLPVMPAVAFAFGFTIRKDKYGKAINPICSGTATDDMLLRLRFRPVLLDNGEHLTVVSYDLKPNFDSYDREEDTWNRLATYSV